MEFKKYNSIENHYRKKYIQLIEAYHGKDEYIVMEKIHGSNFSIWMTADEVKFAKRSTFLKEDEDFFNYKEVYKKNKANLLKLFDSIVSKYNSNEVVFHGELCGGSYEHRDVQRNPTAARVQRGVFYSPNNEFFIFDIKVDGKLLPVLEVDSLVKNSGLIPVPIIAKGSLYQCLDLDTNFVSMIPGKLKLPTIDDNIVEGIVIKPSTPQFLPNGARVIIKKKNEKFSEKSTKKVPKVLTPEEIEQLMLSKKIFLHVEPLITENRLRSVVSKIGKVEAKDFGKILGLFNKDILEDFDKDSDLLLNINKEDKKRVTKLLNGKTTELIRKNLMNIVDGEF